MAHQGKFADVMRKNRSRVTATQSCHSAWLKVWENKPRSGLFGGHKRAGLLTFQKSRGSHKTMIPSLPPHPKDLGIPPPQLLFLTLLRTSYLEPGGSVTAQLVCGTQERRVGKQDWVLRCPLVSQATADLSPSPPHPGQQHASRAWLFTSAPPSLRHFRGALTSPLSL